MALSRKKRVAVIHCAGGSMRKEGIDPLSLPHDCGAILEQYPNGINICEYGCLGGGSCRNVCPKGAISIGKDLACQVDTQKCVGCGRCVKVCPRGLISLEPVDRPFKMACSNQMPGKAARAVCVNSCIACRICEKNCPSNAIHVENNCAIINQDKCIACGICHVKCPRMAIQDLRAWDRIREAAFVHCSGGSPLREDIDMDGVRGASPDCNDILSEYPEGIIKCEWGCLGGGSCVKVCPVKAIRITHEGVARVDSDRCIACGQCERVCPRSLITLERIDRKIKVACSNHLPGKAARGVCANSCIACRICEKNCPSDAVHVEDNCARIDHDRCISCTVCQVKCPRHVIHDLERKRRKDLVAVVHCWGGSPLREGIDRNSLPKDCSKIKEQYHEGVISCACGCVGGGSCVKACPVKAISLSENGVAFVDRDKCLGCGICVKTCPQGLIALELANDPIQPKCSNHSVAAAARKECSNSCIACRICERVCPSDAIHVIDNCAVINPNRCIACGMCAVRCPRGVIHDANGILTVLR